MTTLYVIGAFYHFVRYDEKKDFFDFMDYIGILLWFINFAAYCVYYPLGFFLIKIGYSNKIEGYWDHLDEKY